MKKYGFVYIWRDRKHKRFYIGSHWGGEDDGYVCSSGWMKQAYKRRPEDFKRRILKRDFTNRKQLLEIENYYLSMIGHEEIGKKYYNLRITNFNHWSTDKDLSESTIQRIKKKTKEAMYRPEVREKYLEGMKTRDNRSSDKEVREKRRKSMMGKNKGKVQCVAIEAARKANTGKKHTLRTREKIKEVTHFNKLNKMRVNCKYCGQEGNPGSIARFHNDKCKKRGIEMKTYKDFMEGESRSSRDKLWGKDPSYSYTHMGRRIKKKLGKIDNHKMVGQKVTHSKHGDGIVKSVHRYGTGSSLVPYGKEAYVHFNHGHEMIPTEYLQHVKAK
jgi:hypothetical protein